MSAAFQIKIILFYFVIVFLRSNLLLSQECSSRNTTFRSGEDLTYVISYNWFIVWTEVGEVRFKIEDSKYKSKPAYYFTGFGKTYKSWDWFFKVRDTYESYIDPSSMKPFSFSRNIQEGSYTQLDTYEFNYATSKAVSTYRVNKNPLRTDTVKITNCTFDVLSAFLYSRNLNINYKEKDKNYPLTIILDQELYNINFKYIGIENIKIKYLGEFECLKFSLSLIGGMMFEEGDHMTMWITNDRNRIPILIESPIIIGTVKARIIDIKGNHYPLNFLNK